MAGVSCDRGASERGAVALEYVLIAALVAISLIGVFRYWGQMSAKAVKGTAVSPIDGGALEPVD